MCEINLSLPLGGVRIVNMCKCEVKYWMNSLSNICKEEVILVNSKFAALNPLQYIAAVLA